MRLLLVLLALLAAPSAGAQTSSHAPSPEANTLHPQARAYLSAALDSLERLALRRDDVDWALLRDSTFARAAGAWDVADTHDALAWAVKQIDRHSFLSRPRRQPEGRLIDSRIGYIRVPGYNGPGNSLYADSLQKHIRVLDQAGACGWIVDLRGNGGGNVWAMLAGIGPLLGDSLAGGNLIDGRLSAWHYWNGVASEQNPGGTLTSYGSLVDGEPYQLREFLAPVAVLFDDGTGSSGEAIAVAFRGRPHTRSFGTATAGLASVNRNVALPDGATMIMTVGTYADRTGRAYDLTLEPDEPVAATELSVEAAHDPVTERALTWLGGHAACKASER